MKAANSVVAFYDTTFPASQLVVYPIYSWEALATYTKDPTSTCVCYRYFWSSCDEYNWLCEATCVMKVFFWSSNRQSNQDLAPMCKSGRI